MAEDKKKDQEFAVTDRRKFTAEGELRPDVEPESDAMPPHPAEIPPPSAEPQVAHEVATERELKGPVPPSAAEQQEVQQAYAEAGREVDARLAADLGSGIRPKDLEVTFEKLVTTLYMTAMLQLGVLREQGGTPRVDILGARQSIDTLDLLREKSKGNLTPKESSFLDERLYELRMTYLEVLSALARAPEPPPPPPGGKK